MTNIADALLGTLPKYDPENDPLATPLAAEVREAPVHAGQCAFRYGTLKRDIWELRRELRGIRVFLIQLILAAALSVKAIDFIFSRMA